MKAERAPETTFHTKLSALGDERSYPLQPEKIQALRTEIQQQLSQCHLVIKKYYFMKCFKFNDYM